MKSLKRMATFIILNIPILPLQTAVNIQYPENLIYKRIIYIYKRFKS